MKTALAALLLTACATAYAQSSPVGLWRTLDDKTSSPKAEVRIDSKSDGSLVGSIEKTLVPTPTGLCDKCTDERKDKPLVGLEIIRDLHQSKSDPNVWEGGKILDPNNGVQYRTTLTLVQEGKRLEVRGYYGPFWRTQVWSRIQ